MQLEHLDRGLVRWTAPHPQWEAGAEAGSPADWPEDVGCVAAVVGEHVVVIDPLVPEELWPALDAFVLPRQVSVLKTIRFHSRDRDAVLKRYDAGLDVPDGVVAIRVPDETIYWIPEHAALVPGDRLLGDGQGGVRMCPESWLGYLGKNLGRPTTLEDLRRALRPLLDLPVERVLVSHGEPVRSGGSAALAAALAA